MNYSEAVEYLFKIPRFTEKPTLDHTRRLMEILGVMGEDKKIIHVAGTNGKGSVCTYIAEGLMKNGKTVGLFTSPHLVKVNERIKIQGKDISDEEFLKCFHQVLDAQEVLKSEGLAHSTFFEFVLAIGMCSFYRENVEYIVLETGLGGRLDQTNVFLPVLTVITKIGYDHMEYLGNTLEEIAAEKAGIIKKNVPVVFYGGKEICTKVIEKKAILEDSPYYALKPEMIKPVKKSKKSIDFSLQYSYYGSDVLSAPGVADYQMENVALSYMALSLLTDIRPILRFETVWAGRMEEVLPKVYVDGAHNEDGVEAFLETVKHFQGNKTLLYSSVGDKEYKKIIEKLCESELFDEYYVTKITNYRGIDAQILAKEFLKYTKDNVYIYEDAREGFLQAVENKGEGTVFCVGSLYLVGMIKEILG